MGAWVWVAIAGLGILAAVTGLIAVRTSPKPPQADHRPTSVRGDVVHGDKIVTEIHEAPAAPSSVTTLHQLPPPPGDFTGRKAELDDLLDKVKKGGIAISGLQGAGGIGKTALALMLAEQLASRYPDAQLYLDLKGVSQQPVTPAEAMAHVIHAWNPTANPPEGELSAQYRDVLHGKQALLLLDNAADADQVLPLLPPEGCLALVTSRQHFELPGCYTRSLDMLTPEDARDLVLKIAPRVGDQADGVAELCGYLPFALRNAAGALASRKDLSPVDYMKRLGDAKKKLSLVAASLSLSYDVLSAEQQERWRKLGVFPGSFDAPAAAAVWEVEEDQARDELGELYLRSMVECETEGRYKLHDLSRVYADSKQSKSERAAAQLRHAEHYVNVARAADDLYEEGGESVLAGLGSFDLERGNIEAGQRWASKHEQDDDRAAELCVGYALGEPNVLALRLHPRERLQWLNSVLRAARRLNDRPGEAVALSNMGNAYDSLGEYRRAIEFHEQHLAIAREIGDRLGEGQALINMGNAYHSLGEYRRAIEFQEQSLQMERGVGNRQGEAQSLGNLGNAYYSLGECRRAIAFYEQCLAIAQEIGDRQGEAYALGNLGIAYDSLGEYRRASEFHEQDLAIAREIGDRLGEGSALGNLGNACYLLGEYRRAIELHEQDLAIAREIGDRRGEGSALGGLGNAYESLGEYPRAIESYEQSLAILREIGDRRGEGIALWNMSLALDQLGERAQAIADAQAALTILEQIEHPDAAQVRRKLAEWQGEGQT